MKNILNKVAGLALVAGFVFGMFGCANGATDSTIKTVETPVFSVASEALPAEYRLPPPEPSSPERP